MLQTPDGQNANDIDKIMLLSMWVQHLDKKGKSIIKCGMGKPTYPINNKVAEIMIDYWKKVLINSKQARNQLSKQYNSNIESAADFIIPNCAIDYGHPQGELEAREIMADALNHWYGEHANIKPNNILFTIGGAGALNIIFDVFKCINPDGKIITQLPHYSLYASHIKKEQLIPINTFQLPGFQITADAIQEVIDTQKIKEIIAIIFCEPNNPMGTTINSAELEKILLLIAKYPNIYLIIDGAYEEMRFDKTKMRLFDTLPSKSRKRLILLRSATKGLSAAGERMALICAFNQKIMSMLIEKNIKICGHAPISHQYAYAYALKYLDDYELNKTISFYQKQVKFVQKRLVEIGISLSTLNYQPTGTFYVLADLHEFFEQNTNLKEVKPQSNSKIQTDEDIVYTLLLENNIMLCPLSYFGVDPKMGYVRITCSIGITQLNLAINRIEEKLIAIRKNKLDGLIQLLKQTPNMSQIDSTYIAEYCSINTAELSALELNLKYDKLFKWMTSLKHEQLSEPNYHNAATMIQSHYRSNIVCTQVDAITTEADDYVWNG